MLYSGGAWMSLHFHCYCITIRLRACVGATDSSRAKDERSTVSTDYIYDLLAHNPIRVGCGTGPTRTTSIVTGAGTDPIQQGTLTLTLTIPIGGCLL